MSNAYRLFLPALLFLTACASEPVEPQFRAFDLQLTQPSPTSHYLQVTPGRRGADMPRPRHLQSKAFSEYLRDATGCAMDATRTTTYLGHKKAPAAFMVPVICP
ncbi:MAG: hypothetical protein AB3N23_16425 [Paracoccaceae bacterium]